MKKWCIIFVSILAIILSGCFDYGFFIRVVNDTEKSITIRYTTSYDPEIKKDIGTKLILPGDFIDVPFLGGMKNAKADAYLDWKIIEVIIDGKSYSYKDIRRRNIDTLYDKANRVYLVKMNSLFAF